MSWLSLGEDVAVVCKGQIRLGSVVHAIEGSNGKLHFALVRTCEGNECSVWSTEEGFAWARGWNTPDHNALLATLALTS